MNSVIFNVTLKFIKPLLWILALWFLFRGHDAPGGGFMAGLIAACSVLLQILSSGWKGLRFLRENIFTFLGLGLLTCIASGFVAFSVDNPFMTGRWIWIYTLHLGSPLLMDFGVFLVVFFHVDRLRRLSLGKRRRKRSFASMNLYLSILIFVLVTSGVYCLLLPNLMRIIIGVILLSNAANLIVFVAGGLTGRVMPIVPQGSEFVDLNTADPVPQALILTAIVISFAITAYFLVLCREFYRENGDSDLSSESFE